ncbi:hypothetical protein [Vibrio sp. THAF190c]|uniref:hypothetical protein n=1 Tax=Vibrio sp. THAF190c TaxID=2587865 RepID=UPI001267CE66|nr:hypothetical protein [Vibrio sp. THAF190c]QFT13600.1 hypothetical protein FIV04_26955 [Vibrio sp. THAF190c]
MSTDNLKLLTHHHQLENAVLTNESIPREVKNLLAGIATFFNVNNQCAFPNRQQLSKRTGYCPNHITALIKKAKDLGLLISTPQFIQVDGESAPRQIANKYEFVLEKFGLFYNKAKALLNKNRRKKDKANTAHQEVVNKRIDAVNQMLDECREQPQQEQPYYWEDYTPPD